VCKFAAATTTTLVAGKQNHLLLHPFHQPQHIHHLQPRAAQVESKMLMQEKPQKQNPKEHKFSKHTHTHTHTHTHIHTYLYTYIHTYIRISIYKVTCEVHALATHTHTPSSTFFVFFGSSTWQGGKRRNKER
jgi:K+-sensing histidine kinase KdpD